MISACVVPTVKHGRGSWMVQGGFAGDTVGHLFRIQGTLNQTVGKAFQMKLVQRMPRVCKAVIKAKDGYFEESQT